jgi:signal peptidase I
LTDTAATEVNDLEATEQDRTETPLESLASICTVLAIGLFVMTFIFQNFEIPSASMVKTLLIGDHVLVDRISLAPPAKWAPFTFYRDVRRGDVIVFFKPGEPDLRNGVVYLNGVAQNEPQAGMPADDGDPQHAFNPYRDDFPAVPPGPYDQVTASWGYDLPNHIVDGDLVVPPGKVFAMGDNRTESLDGRFWGFVPRENIVGRPMFVYWSFETPADQINKQTIGERLGFMGHILIHIFDETRWKRTFHLIK